MPSPPPPPPPPIRSKQPPHEECNEWIGPGSDVCRTKHVCGLAACRQQFSAVLTKREITHVPSMQTMLAITNYQHNGSYAFAAAQITEFDGMCETHTYTNNKSSDVYMRFIKGYIRETNPPPPPPPPRISADHHAVPSVQK